jgi:hypothetical protein
MKKKLFFVVAVVLCAVIGVCSFAGCGKPTAAEEFDAFREKIITVMKDNGLNTDNFKANQSAEAVNNLTKLEADYDSKNYVEKIKEIVLKDSEVKSDIEDVESARQEMYDQALSMAIVVGDGMVNNHNADTIYNTSVLIDCWWKTYMEFKSSGTLTTINTYTPATEEDCAYAGVVYLDFKSKDDYNFVMLVIWEDGRVGYRYGNNKKQFVYFDYEPVNEYAHVYISSKAGEGYISRDAQIVKDCYEVVQSQFDGLNVEDYEYLTGQKYTIDEEEWLSLCAKYFPNEVE